MALMAMALCECNGTQEKFEGICHWGGRVCALSLGIPIRVGAKWNTHQ